MKLFSCVSFIILQILGFFHRLVLILIFYGVTGKTKNTKCHPSVTKDFTKARSGEPETGNGEQESESERSAVLHIKTQNGRGENSPEEKRPGFAIFCYILSFVEAILKCQCLRPATVSQFGVSSACVEID